MAKTYIQSSKETIKSFFNVVGPLKTAETNFAFRSFVIFLFQNI